MGLRIPLYPRAGASVYDEDAVLIPAGGGIYDVTRKHYSDLCMRGDLVRSDPLNGEGGVLVPSSPFAAVPASTPDRFPELSPFSARVNAAIQAANALGGGSVYVPFGNYAVTGVGTDRILMLSNTELVFAPGCTITTGVFAATSIVLSVDTTAADKENIRIIGSGLRIVGDRSGSSTQYLLHVNVQSPSDVCRNIYFSDITIEDSGFDGLTVGGNVGCFPDGLVFERITATGCDRLGGSAVQSAGVSFIDCHFDENGIGGSAPRSGFDVEVDDALTGSLVNRDITFLRCTFNGNDNNGLYVQAPAYGHTARIRVLDCDAHDNGAYGFVSNANGSEIINCRARRNLDGAYLGGDCIVSDCTFEDNTARGVRVQIAGNYIRVKNTLMRFNGTDGLLLNTLGSSRGVISVESCTIFGNRGKGIYLSECQNALVLGNTVECNFGEGMIVSGSANCSIRNNLFLQNGTEADNSVDQIYVDNISYANDISGNTVRQSATFLHCAAVTDGASTNTVFKLAAYASPRASEYVGMRLRILSGSGSGLSAWATAYNSATKFVTVSSAAGAVPDDTSVIEIVGGRLYSGAVVSATATTVVLPDDLASALDDAYTGHTLIVTSGTGAGQRVAISDYVGSTRTLTVASMSPALTDSSVVDIVVSNRPRNGVLLTSAAYYTKLHSNDWWYAGATGALSDSGTSTNAANNRAS